MDNTPPSLNSPRHILSGFDAILNTPTRSRNQNSEHASPASPSRRARSDENFAHVNFDLLSGRELEPRRKRQKTAHPITESNGLSSFQVNLVSDHSTSEPRKQRKKRKLEAPASCPPIISFDALLEARRRPPEFLFTRIPSPPPFAAPTSTIQPEHAPEFLAAPHSMRCPSCNSILMCQPPNMHTPTSLPTHATSLMDGNAVDPSVNAGVEEGQPPDTLLPFIPLPHIDYANLPLERSMAYAICFMEWMGLSSSQFVYGLVRVPSPEEKKGWNAVEQGMFQRRAIRAAHFISGRDSRFSVSKIVQIWWHSKYGRRDNDSPLMFSPTSRIPYHEIASARAGLSSFALQLVKLKVARQVRNATHKDSPLVVRLPTKKRPLEPNELLIADWDRFGVDAHNMVTDAHRKQQPILWDILESVATPKDSPVNAVRTRRPTSAVVSTAISKLTFSHSTRARLGPLQEGLFQFASLASYDTFQYNSHVGNTPSYNTILNCLYHLGDQSAARLLEICRDPGFWFWITTDNVQNYNRPRDFRFGREAKMSIGMAATVWVAPRHGPDPSTFLDYDKKELLRRSFKRDKLTTAKLLSELDTAHERVVFTLQWLLVLGKHVPDLASLKTEASTRLRTQACRQQLPEEATECFPLPTLGGSETNLPDLLRNFLDFLASAGITSADYLKRMVPIGGDGLTYELTGKLKAQRQFHESAFDSLRLLDEKLEPWHTGWTNDGRIIDEFLDDAGFASKDPGTLGWAVSKISRTIPKDQGGHYNYAQGSELLYLVCDARMLDCWRLSLLDIATDHAVVIRTPSSLSEIVADLRTAGHLPSTDNFIMLAGRLHNQYTTEMAVYRAAHGCEKRDSPCWKDQTASLSAPALRALDTAGQASAEKHRVVGIQSLAQAKAFMRETMRSRELVWSIAQGDVGRMWEQLKFLLFAFAGSTHLKYAQYVLEMMCNLIYESTPELRRALLSTLVANPSGRPGAFHGCDKLQEYLNRILEAIVQHKGAEFGHKFIPNAIARNLALLQHIKGIVPEGVGLGERTKRHHKPGIDAEMTRLLREMADEGVHQYKDARTFRSAGTPIYSTQFQRGRLKSDDSLLRTWTTRSMLTRDEDPTDASAAAYREDENVEPLAPVNTKSPFFMTCIDKGETVNIDEIDIESMAHRIVDMMEGKDSEYSSDEDFPEDPCSITQTHDWLDEAW